MPMPARRTISSRACSPWLPLVLALGCNSQAAQDPASAELAAEQAAEATPAHPENGEVVAISGPGGVHSPALEAGTFLGKGAHLEAGQVLETPRGTLAELRLQGGIRVRMNEDTALTLPAADAASRLVLSRGEIVVLTEPGSTAELAVAAGDEVLTLTRGEAQIRHAGAARRFAVVSGSAELQAPSRTLTLAPGESIDAPLPEEQTRRPELSLAPLQETSWSRTFEAAARIADEVPAGVGSLTARRPGSSAERQRLHLTDQAVTVNISGRIAHTEVEQAFFNDRPAVLEGIYRFPMPGDGSVSGLSLLVGNRWMEGEIVEKTRARRIFSSIVDATIPRDPALLEWERGNLFKLRIFPIPGRGERRVRLSYTQVLPVSGDHVRYRFPLAGSGAGGTEIERFKFDVTVDGEALDQAQLANIGTPMMALDRSMEGQQVKLSAEREHFIPTADIGVDIPVAEEEARIHTATHLDRDGQAYFMVSVRPELELPTPQGPTTYAFVLDRSHSTSPELWTVARGMVEALSTSMDPEDRFAVLACDTACDLAPGGLLAPQPSDLDEAQRFLDAQDMAGASDLGGMLVSAAEALDRSGAAGERVIVYLGDGTPSSGELAADKLARRLADPLRDTRVMAVALGARSDLTTLGAIVQQTGGDILRADPRDDRQQLVRELRLRSRVPVVNDLELDLPDGMTAVHRHGSAGLRSGDSLVLLGKLRRPVHDEIIVRARGAKGPVEARFRVDLEADRSSPGEHRHLPRTWAQAEIAHLTQTRGAEAREEIIALSKHYTVMSRHTSLLVLENDAMYREFNVVRAAKNTDKWDGKLTESGADNGRVTAQPSPTTTAEVTSKSDVKPEFESRDEEAKREDPPPPAGAPPADPAEPEPDVLGPGRNRGRTGSSSPSPIPGGVVGGGTRAEDSNKDKGDEGGFGGRGGLGPSPEPEPVEELEKRPRSAHDVGGEDDQDADEQLADVDLGDEDPLGGLGGGGKKSGGSSRPASKTPSRPKPQKKHKKKSAWSDFPPGGGSSGGWGRRSRGWGRTKIRQLLSRPVASPSSRALTKVEALRRTVDADPTQRGAHGKLVRAALRAGHAQSLDFARAWAEVDPDHPPALLSLADAMAADGDPMALRAYESALEIRPFNRRHHAELARAYESKGDLRRACSHRRAVVSIDPSDAEHHAELVRCLHREGRRRDAFDALDDGRRRASRHAAALGRADAELASGVATPAAFSLHGGAQLKLHLSWSDASEDLDLAVVDAKGRRLSGLRPAGKARTREGTGSEDLTLRRVGKSVFIEVTRPSPTRALEGERAPLRGELVIRTSHSKRRIPVVIGEGTTRVAKVFWALR